VKLPILSDGYTQSINPQRRVVVMKVGVGGGNYPVATEGSSVRG
jgi:hypothetical protein